MCVLEINNLCKAYSYDHKKKIIFDGFDFKLEKKRLVALMGPSGSGKTTLLNLISGIDKADGGKITLMGQDISQLSLKGRNALRRTVVGLVFQDFHLIDSLNIEDNILLPATLAGSLLDEDEVRVRFNEWTRKTEVEDLLEKYPNQLSGGERQRTAICRAVMNEPQVLLADEPTGNLDVEMTVNIMELFVKMKEKQSILMVTHDAYAASFCDEVDFFRNGKIQKVLNSDGSQKQMFEKILYTMADLDSEREAVQ